MLICETQKRGDSICNVYIRLELIHLTPYMIRLDIIKNIYYSLANCVCVCVCVCVYNLYHFGFEKVIGENNAWVEMPKSLRGEA